MRPVTQTRTGSAGNCFAAAIASILEVPLQETDGLHEDTVNGYLARHGLRYEQVPYDPDNPPVGYTTIEGVSPRGGQHACVAYNGKLTHDPHSQDGTGRGLVKPERYGLLLPLGGSVKDEDTSRRTGYVAHYDDTNTSRELGSTPMAMDNERDDLNKIYAAAIEKWLEAKRANADVETLRKLKLAMQKAHRNFVRGHENRRGRTQDVKMSSLLALLAAYLIGRYYQSRAERQKRGSGSLFSSTGTSRP